MKHVRRSNRHQGGKMSRRSFMGTAGAVGVATLLSGTGRVFARGSDKIRVGLIGCGGRGTGAARDCVESSPGVEIVAMGDMFEERLEMSLKTLTRNMPGNVKVTEDTCFVGFDAYKKVVACDVDMVILATPPHFRPEHLKAAVEADKHVFMEKPVAVDPVGVRSVIASSELAQEKRLSIVAGTQNRRSPAHIEIMKRVHDGAIGEILGGQGYRLQGGVWVKPRQPGWTDMEWQCRNWYYFVWLSGDFPVEMVIHGMDLVNWAMGSHPVKVLGIGGRIARTGPEYGNVYDHFAFDFEYPNGARISYMMTHIENCTRRRAVRIVGTKGTAVLGRAIEGENPFQYTGPRAKPQVLEHADLIASIREGKPINEGRQVAESTLTAIMGRMSAYTGQEVTRDWAMNSSKLDLRPERYDFAAPAPVRPVAIPGKTKLI